MIPDCLMISLPAMTPSRASNKPFRADNLTLIEPVIKREDSAGDFASESVLLHR